MVGRRKCVNLNDHDEELNSVLTVIYQGNASKIPMVLSFFF